MSIGLRTLVLRQDYHPITLFPIGASTIRAEDAIKLVLKESCRVVESYERKVLTPSRDDLYWPSVIVNQVPMKSPQHVRLTNESLYWRDKGKCQYCSKILSIKTLTRDHVTPTSRGGANEWHNVVAACSVCNLRKASSSPRGQWKPISPAYVPTLSELIRNRSQFPIVLDDEKWLNYLGVPWEAQIIFRAPSFISAHNKKKMIHQYNKLSAMMTETEVEYEQF